MSGNISSQRVGEPVRSTVVGFARDVAADSSIGKTAGDINFDVAQRGAAA